MENRTIARALNILELIADSGAGLSQARISNDLDIPKSTLHSFLNTLVRRRYLKQDDDGLYTLDIAALTLGNAYLSGTELSQEVRAILIRLSKELNVTAHLATLDGVFVMYVDKIDPPGSAIKLASSIGTRIPSHLTAVGRACLAQLPQKDLKKHYDLNLSANYKVNITDSIVMNELEATLQRGYAIDYGLTLAGVTCVAVPLKVHDNFYGSLGVSFLSKSKSITEVAKVLDSAAEEIARSVDLRTHQ